MMTGILLAALMMSGTTPSNTVDVSGSVFLPKNRPAAQAVVFLEGGVKAKPLSKVVIDQRNKQFIPRILAIPANTLVEFPNNDSIYHNVFAYYDAKKFDLGMYPRGAKKEVRFEKVGVVAILCNVHPEMSAFIYIVDTPFYAVTDNRGKFQIKEVPAGEYTLNGWHESGVTFSQKVIVKAGSGASFELNLARNKK